MSLPKVVICGAARSPIGSIGGALADILPKPLLVQVCNSLLQSAKCDPKDVDYISAGWGIQDVRFMNMARTTGDAIGLPATSPGTTIQENCASGGAAVHDIARRILLGEINVGIAGGVESMSNIPRLLFTCRTKRQLYGDLKLVDGLMGGLVDPTVGKGELMGLLTERLVEEYGVSRELQDEIAFRSHENAMASWEKGMYDYVTPIEVETNKGVVKVEKDEAPRKYELSYFQKQKPYFKPEGGTITSANASSLNDGAAAILLASETRAEELGLPILAELRAFGNVGVPKEFMGEGAFKVLPKLMDNAGIQITDIDYFEINEAFAAVVGAATKEFPELKLDRVNQWGSGISIGHPVGCTGARQLCDMVHQLQKRGKKIGLTSRCVGGGMGSGEVLVRLD